jgi:hypothetical protein
MDFLIMIGRVFHLHRWGTVWQKLEPKALLPDWAKMVICVAPHQYFPFLSNS